MADSASNADCRQRATSRRSRGAPANEHVAASKTRGGGDTTQRKSESIMRISRAKGAHVSSEIGNSLAEPGRRRVGMESHRPDRAWARDFKISPAGLGEGWARRGRPGPARPHLRKLAPPAKTVGLKIMYFLQFENNTKRDTQRDISTIFVRNEMP